MINSLFKLSMPILLASKLIASGAPVSYELPAGTDSELLLRSTVLVSCGVSKGTGVAVGPNHIITAAHVVAGCKDLEIKTECIAFNNVTERHVVPAYEAFSDESARANFLPIFSSVEDLRILEIKKIYFPDATRIEHSEEKPEGLNLGSIKEKLNEALHYGLGDVKNYASYGVNATVRTFDSSKLVSVEHFRIFGPDVAILECSEPHGLPFLPIGKPAKERKLLHVVGLSGTRYQNSDSSQKTAGAPFNSEHANTGIVYVYDPAIYGQRFTCLQASPDHYQWFNRAFIKVVKGKFFMDDQVYPNAPKGFGLLATGDSGAGVVYIEDGRACLAGVVSSGQIEPIFLGVRDICENKDLVNRHSQLRDLCKIYEEALATTESDKRWFITQSLADLTHLRDWINFVVANTHD